MKLALARGVTGKTTLVWESKPVPADLKKFAAFDLHFFGGQGFVQQPPVSFVLHVNGEKAVDIPAVTLKSQTWEQNGYVLKYVREASTEEYGTYTLTIPTVKLLPGRPVEIKVVATPNNSCRWFGICENM